MAKAKSPVPTGHHTVTPQLTLDNAAQTLEWYAKALGAQEVSRAIGPDGKIMHAEIRVGDSPIMVNDAMMGSRGPKSLGGSPASLWVYVDDADALFNRAKAAGAKVAEGPDAGSILGRSLWQHHRPGGLHLDDRDAQGRSHARGDEEATRRVDGVVLGAIHSLTCHPERSEGSTVPTQRLCH